jgi:Fe-S-cluster-containing hydrogenase component 2
MSFIKKYPCQQVCAANAIKVAPDRHLRIDQQWCLGCGYCAYICPMDAIYINNYWFFIININLCLANENSGGGQCRNMVD